MSIFVQKTLTDTSLTSCTFIISDFEQTKEKVLNWAKQFDTFCFLDNHQYQIEPHTIECILAAGSRRQLKANAGNALWQLQKFIDEKQSWLFGHLGYDLKNEIENLDSFNPDGIRFPDLFFFEPEVIIRLSENKIIIEADQPDIIFDTIQRILPSESSLLTQVPHIQNRLSKDEYISIIKELKNYILRGDCYEINFCQEFYAKGAEIDPGTVYKRLGFLSPNPFSALYRNNDKWLMCASPERFIKKEGSRILSQPIKGTSKRIPGNRDEDMYRKNALSKSTKDRSENVMVVDLVRNDLAKICKEGTVKVDELFGIYSFPQVHQMISTISGELKKDISFTEMIKATFPMGSMTGAPKKRVMELIEKFEKTKRGIFSGAVGYISPAGDFDFNVVIRSIMYNENDKYLSIQAGSGITFFSNPEDEWDECLLKAEAIKNAIEEKKD